MRNLFVLFILLLVVGCGKNDAPPVAPTPAVATVDIQKLVGKWLRPDGGYILDLQSASADGKLVAAYLNPNPIHVAQATWRASDELGLVIFVELRDAGYPGATYRLQYRANDDSLAGTYTQPAVGQTFDVSFVRQP